MKTLRVILIWTVVLAAAMSVNAQKKGDKTVVFNANLHCGSCKAKVEKNIAFEKGVKDLKVDMDKQTITVVFREDKNTEEDIRKAIEKLDVQVKGKADAAACCPKAGTCEKAKQGKCCGGENCVKNGCQKEKK